MSIKYLGDFKEGLALIKIEKQYGFINNLGEIQFQNDYYCKNDFYDGLALIQSKSNKKYGYINKYGEIIIKPIFEYANNFSEGLASVCFGNKWGYINASGEIVIELKFDNVNNFYNGYATVRKGNLTDCREALIDKNGNIIIDFKYPHLGRFSDGLINYKYFDNTRKELCFNTGFIDLEGNKAIEGNNYNAQSHCTYEFKDGVSTLYNFEKRKWVAINTKGDIILDNNYDNLKYSGNGLFCFSRIDHWNKKDDRKNGLMNIEGNIIGNELFNRWFFFKENLAVVEYGKNSNNLTRGIIDKNGEFIINPVIKCKISGFSEGLCRIGDFGFIDKNGIFVIGDYKGKHVHEIFTHKHTPIPEEYFAINKGGLEFKKRISNLEQVQINNFVKRQSEIFNL